MQKVIRMVPALIIGIAISGCASVNTTSSVSTEQISIEKTYCGDKMLNALAQGDFSGFVHDFSKELKESVTEKFFKKLEGDLDASKEAISEWKFLDTLERGGVCRTEIWKVVLSRRGTKINTNIERIFYVTVARLDGRAVVIGFKFDSIF